MHGASQWLHNLALLKPLPYRPWRHAIRLSLGTGLPLTIGVFTGHTGVMLYVALGAFLAAVAVRLDPYRERFRQLAITAVIGSLGCLIGPEVGGHGLATLFLLMAMGLFSGLISGYGAAFSTGAMQMLVLAVVNAHAPVSVPAWMIFLCFLSGAAFVGVMLAIGAMIDNDRPERLLLSQLFTKLANLARAAAALREDDSTDNRLKMLEARRAVTDATKTAYNILIEKRSHGRERTRYEVRTAAVLSLVNQMTMSIIAAREGNFAVTAQRLDEIAKAWIDHTKQAPPVPDNAKSGMDETLILAGRLATTLWHSKTTEAPRDTAPDQPREPVFARSLKMDIARRLVLGREVVISALRLSLCMGIAVFAQRFMSGDHSYWLPMTVALVLKPDFGSVFVRAIHRSLGTIIGVCIAIAIAVFIPKGGGFIPVIMFLCALLPFAGLRSYAAMVSLLTPVILLMIDLVAPGTATGYGFQRLTDTLLGAAIALVFGYLIWPRAPRNEINAGFATALGKMGDLLKAATAPLPDDAAALENVRQTMTEREFSAFRALSDVRTVLGRLIAEPPPAGREAATWFPAVAGAERLTGAITAYAEGRRLGDPPPDNERATRAQNALANIARVTRQEDIVPARPKGREKDDRFGDVEAEIAWLAGYLSRRPRGRKH